MTEGLSLCASGPLPTKVSLRVPATTANLGPAYDTLGMALSIFMTVTVEVAEEFSVTVEGQGAEYISTGEDNLVVQSCMTAFRDFAKKPMPPLKFVLQSNIPFGCGCGSSSAAAMAGFVAGMRLCGLTMETVKREQLLNIIADIEGHPDNAAPALYGGIQLGYKNEQGSVHTYRVPCPPYLSVVLFVPNKLMKASTHVTRSLVPEMVSLKDAIHNISRTAILMLALSTNDLRLLRDSADCLHEMQRSNAIYPHYKPCANAAREAGAEYAFLSGAGPTVCAFVSGRRSDLMIQPVEERKAETVAQAMVQAAASVGVEGRAIITMPSDVGLHLYNVKDSAGGVEYASL